MIAGAKSDTTCNSSIADTVKFVYGHMKAFIIISRGKLRHWPERILIQEVLIDEGEIFQW